MSGNVHGGNYRSSLANRMRAFDKLPPEVRAALANAVDSWAPQPMLTKLRRGMGASSVVSLIQTWDRLEIAERERDRAAARGVYSGNRPDVLKSERAVPRKDGGRP